ncbi:MAG: hypothetical protein QNK37_29535 [Acidobacteriota bacterium]|nr:hypothetical protein [Acidobacteriota bacterium]
MELLQTIIAITFVSTGAGLAAHALYLLHKNHRREVADLFSGLFAGKTPVAPQVNVEAHERAADHPDEPSREAGEKVKTERVDTQEIPPVEPVDMVTPVIFERAKFQERLTYKDIPLRQTGRDQHYDLDTWGRMIAWLIYSRLVSGVSGHVGSPLASTMFKGSRIDDTRRMERFNWIRLFVDESLVQDIRSYYNLNKVELNDALKKHTLTALEGFLADDVFKWCRDRVVLHLYDRDKNGDTVFDVDFLPLMDRKDGLLACEAHLVLGSGIGKITVPREEEQNHFRFADRTLSLTHGYLPLSGEFAHVVEIGPHASCHIQTRKPHFASTLTLGWRESDEVGVAGTLEVHHIIPADGPAESFFLRRNEEGARDEQLLGGRRARIPDNEDGRQTTCEIWRRCKGRENLVLTLVLRERKPPLDDLPDCIIFENGLSSVETEKDMVRLVASQVYFTTKNGKNTGDILFLDSDEGRAFRDDPEQGPVLLSDRKREPLRSCVKLCMAPGQLSRLHEWLGDREMPRALATRVLELIREDEDFSQVFPEDTLKDLLPGEGVPGLTVEVGADETLGADAVLVRCLPVFTPNRRREIFGRFHFEAWPEAIDLSQYSCRDHLTYFTDHPAGKVGLHLSRFSVYEIQMPRVFGAVKMHIISAGTNRACFEVINQSAGSVIVNGHQLHRTNDCKIEFGNSDMEVSIEIGGKKARVLLYGRPAAQLDEPFFIPEPARLQLYGLALHRRLERTNWKASEVFRKMWENPGLEEQKDLLGVSQATGAGFLTVVERGVRLEHHFFAGKETVLQREGHETLAAGECTFKTGALPGDCSFGEKAGENIEVKYRRLDLNGHQVSNVALLTEDYWDTWIEEVEPNIPENCKVSRIELVRCDASDLSNKRAHLYMVETVGEGDMNREGWLFRPDGGIRNVRLRNHELEQKLDADKPLVGPLGPLDGRLFLVDWDGEEGTPVSFDVEDHEEQIRQYLSDGFFSLVKGMSYAPGGKLEKKLETYDNADPMFISSDPLHIHYDRQGTGSRRCLNFDPRDYSSFFDKDSFRLFYSGDVQSFVMTSELHRKDPITPKTVFLVIPEGGRPVLGSHALPPVKIPGGSSFLVLPGLVFKFSQGPIYYA